MKLEPWGILFAVAAFGVSAWQFSLDAEDRRLNRTNIAFASLAGGYGRPEALETLLRNDVVLVSLKAPNAYLAELKTELQGLNLSFANLERAFLRKSDLSRASLEAAILTGADLQDVVLDRTDLRRADLRDVNWSNDICRMENGSRVPRQPCPYFAVHGADLRDARRDDNEQSTLKPHMLFYAIGDKATLLDPGLYVWSCWREDPGTLWLGTPPDPAWICPEGEEPKRTGTPCPADLARQACLDPDMNPLHRQND